MFTPKITNNFFILNGVYKLFIFNFAVMNQVLSKRIFPAEWHEQSAIQITWPDELTDWAEDLPAATKCYVELSNVITKHQNLIVVCRNPEKTRTLLSECHDKRLFLVQAEINDTWARDHGFITVIEKGKPRVLDFGFNGWGGKFSAELDNKINRHIRDSGLLSPEVIYEDLSDFIMEGGSIESDGEGTLLTTSECLLSKTRNPKLSKDEIALKLEELLGAERILWLDHGFLAGDDTDSHIDTLARFCSKNTIAYVSCSNPDDEHYEALKKMEAQLKSFKQTNGAPYNLIQLPMADAVYSLEDGHRLPATYANFLITNHAVLVPFYNLPSDELALECLQNAFPGRELIPVDCSPLIRQHGSLHCITMQYPIDVLGFK